MDYLFVFEGTSIRKIPGNYSDYLLLKRFAEEEKEENAKTSKDTRPPKERKGLTYNEQRELQLLEVKIEELEAALEALEQELHKSGLTPEDYARIGAQQTELNQELEECSDRWLELSLA